jgi:hypothetical protein
MKLLSSFTVIMRNITLEFSSFLELIAFTLVIDNSLFEANGTTLKCSLWESEIELARNGYAAKVVAIQDGCLQS